MKLYYSSGSCSLATHIALEEAGAKFDTQRVNLREGEQRKPEYLKINPKAAVPALQLDDGTVITEVPAVISFVADTHPEAKLLAAPGQVLRAKQQEWMAWCSSTVHVAFKPLFRNKDDEAARKNTQEQLDRYDAWMRGPFIFGDQFCAADAYTVVFTRWALALGLKVGDKMRSSVKKLLERPGVQRAITTQQLTFENL